MSDQRFKSWTSISDIAEPFKAHRAFFMSEVEMITFTAKQENPCDVLVHQGRYIPGISYSAFAYQKNFSLKEPIDYFILKIKQSGIQTRISRRHLRQPLIGDCQDPLKEVDFANTVFLFLVLGSGLGLSFVTLVAEHSVKHFRRLNYKAVRKEQQLRG